MRMPITESIVNRMHQILKRPIFIGVCGRAGSGKSSLVKRIVDEIAVLNIPVSFYYGDWRFRLDSSGRKKWIEEKWKSGMDEYIRAINQYSWWDFEKIYHDLEKLANGGNIVIDDAYDRTTGKKGVHVEMKAPGDGIIFYENCVLGGVEILNKLDIIIMVNEDDILCFNRLAQKDSARRAFPDILARTLMTMYSENLFFKLLLERFSNKLLVSDSGGMVGGCPKIEDVKYLPVPAIETENTPNQTGTIFIDLESIAENSRENLQELIVDNAGKLKELRKKGNHMILTTTLPYNQAHDIYQKLKEHGIIFDQLVSDLPVGSRQVVDNHQRTKLYHVKTKKDLDEVGDKAIKRL
ncbi:MAG: hypothetical protein HZB65_02595 [Candidatus Aenigmarchaeota archaeon]|nr:hypothetical protein [Candidatus Aenigmarchaeota archaeon]